VSHNMTADQSSHIYHTGFVSTVFMVYSHVLPPPPIHFVLKGRYIYEALYNDHKKKTSELKNCIYWFLIV
jgi:hypothetical protein